MSDKPMNAVPGLTSAALPRRGERLWSVHDVSDYLGVPVATLHYWRHLGEGPRAFKVGRHLRYDPAAVQVWLHRDAA
jgi:hypothetical protein